MNNADATLVAAYARSWTRPDRARLPALVAENATLDYAALHERVARAARAAGGGRGRGDFVAVAMERSLEQLIAILGAMAAGACPCPLEPRLADEEPRAASPRWDWPGCCTAPRTRARPPSGLPAAACCPPSAWRWANPPVPALAPDAPALLFTSGSTGHPKGVLLSHRGLMNNARGVLAHSGLTPDDRLLHVMPLHHTNALNNQVFTPLLAGARVALAGRFRAEDMPGLLARWRPTIMTGVPTMYARMLDLAFEPASLAGLRYARCGSAPITEALHRRIEAFLGCPLLVSYGLSEATCTSTMNPPARGAWARWARCWPASAWSCASPTAARRQLAARARSASRATA